MNPSNNKRLAKNSTRQKENLIFLYLIADGYIYLFQSLLQFLWNFKSEYSRIAAKSFFAASAIFLIWNILSPRAFLEISNSDILSKLKSLHFFKDNDSEQKKTNEKPKPTISVLKISPQKIESSISFPGLIEHSEKIDITSKISGTIKNIRVKEGDVVKKNQLLAEIDIRPLEIELTKQLSNLESSKSALNLAVEKYEKAKSSIELKFLEIEKRKIICKEAKSELEKNQSLYIRKETLFKEGGIAKEELDNAKIQYIASEAKYNLAKHEIDASLIGFKEEDIKKRGIDYSKEEIQKKDIFIKFNTRIEKAEKDLAASQMVAAKAGVESVKEMIRNSKILSPINGVVAIKNKSTGDYINQGGVTNSEHAILVLLNIDSIYAKAQIQENEIQNVRPGSIVEFSADAYPKESFLGTVTIIQPFIDSLTHTFEVKSKLKNNNLKLKPGMFIRGRLKTSDRNFGILIPSTSIFKSDEKTTKVFKVKNNLLYSTPVTTGREILQSIEILSGLDPEDIIATEKTALLRDEMEISPKF